MPGARAPARRSNCCPAATSRRWRVTRCATCASRWRRGPPTTEVGLLPPAASAHARPGQGPFRPGAQAVLVACCASKARRERRGNRYVRTRWTTRTSRRPSPARHARRGRRGHRHRRRGTGSAIAANKVRGMRAAMATTPTLARYAAEHNGANVLALGPSLRQPKRGPRNRGGVSGHPHDRAALHPPARKVRSRRHRRARHDCVGSPAPDSIVTEEVMAATGSAGPRRAARATALQRECCPTACRRIDAGANRIGVHAGGGVVADVAGVIDHTLLKPRRDAAGNRAALPGGGRVPLRDGVREPDLGGPRRPLLRPHGVGVCSVVGFPLGATTADVKQFETRGRSSMGHRDRHGDQRRRAQVRRPAHGRARHRRGDRRLPPGASSAR